MTTTLPDPEELFPPDRFVRVRDVAVFDEHEGDGRNGKPKRVTAADLERLAANCNKKFVSVLAPTPITLGHSKEGDVDEADQPDVCGWAVRFSVKPLLGTGRKALFCDFYLRRKYANALEEFPHRSIEWWRDRDDISPVSLLKTTPERDLPIVKFDRDPAGGEVYRYVFTPPAPPTSDTMTGTGSDEKATADAAAAEAGGSRALLAKVEMLADELSQLKSMFTRMLDAINADDGDDEDDDGGGDDLLAPAGGGDDPAGEEPKEEPKEKPKTPAKSEKDGEPEKYEAGGGCYAGPGSTYTPDAETRTKMSRSTETEDRVKFERKVREEVERETADIRRQYNRMKAEKAVADLDAAGIDFGDDAEREAEITFCADLLEADRTGEALKAHGERIAKKYRRKPAPQPDSLGAARAVQYSRTDEPASALASEADVQAYVSAADAARVAGREIPTVAEWAAARAGKK